MIVGSANAVNLTDGLDGLAIMPSMIAAGALGVIAYAVGRVDFTEYLDVHYVPGTGEILIFCSALIGGGLGFLWYNAPPRRCSWGIQDRWRLVGPWAHCGCHQTRNRLGHHWRFVRGRGAFCYYPSALFQTHRKTRVPNGADPSPFRKKGWAEPQIVIRFWIIALILAMIGMATLKVR